MTYETYLKWNDRSPFGASDGFRGRYSVPADSHQAAAASRVSMLVNPERYTGVIVVGQGYARVFDVVSTGVTIKERT